MIQQSDQAIAAWRANERTLDAIVTINNTDYVTADIMSLDYDSGAFTGDTFSVGSNYENSITLKFAHLVEGLKSGMTVKPKIGVKTSSGYEYSPLGVFIISDDIQMDRNNDETTIKAYDQMCLMEGAYTSKLSYPAKMIDVIAEIANKAGVLLNTSDIAVLPKLADLPSAITGLTYRNAIGLIAQFYAGFALFDRDGKLTIRTIATPDYVLSPDQYEQGGLTKNEAPFKIGGIQVQVTTSTTDSTGTANETTTTMQAGATTGSQIKLTNNLMTADRLEIIWATLKDVIFYPFSLNWFGNPAIEAGDWLTLKDTKGNEFNVPNNSFTLSFNGSLSAVSKADQTGVASSSYSWGGELSQAVQQLAGRPTGTGNYIYGTDTIYPPLNAKINDLWYKQNGNAVEMWTFERQSDGTGKWVLTVSDTTGAKIKAEVEEQMKDVPVAISNAQKAVDTANGAVKQAGFSTDTANQAKTQAATAASDALKALTNSTDALGGVTQAQADAKSAIDSATAADASATTALNNAKNALATANGTASSLADLKTEVLAKADITVVDDLKGTVANQGLLLTKTGNELALKADQETVDTINQTVKNQDVKLTATANAVALKADQTVVDKVSKTVDSQGLAITAATDGLKLKADNSRVDSLNETVTKQGLEITAQAGLLKSKVSQSDFDGMVIGGTNLLFGTSSELQTANDLTGWGSCASVSPHLQTNKEQSEKVGVYTVRVWIEGNTYPAAIVGNVFDADGNRVGGNSYGNLVNPNAPGYSVLQLKVADGQHVDSVWIAFGSTQTNASNVSWKELKMEFGTVATAWSPAPEDLATSDALATLDGTVKTQSTLLQQTQNELLGKVDVTVVDGLKKTIDTHTAEIKANADGLLLKSNQTTVDALAGRITTAEGRMTVFDNEIKQAVSKTELTTQLGGYATQSWTSGQISTTADKLNLSVSKVQSDFDNLTTGAPNLILNSGRPTSLNHWTGSGSGTQALTIGPHDWWKNSSENMFVLYNDKAVECYASSDRVQVKAGHTYTAQFEGFSSDQVVSVDLWFLGRKYGSSKGFEVAQQLKINLVIPSLERVVVTFTVDEAVDEGYLRFDNNGSKTPGAASALFFTDVKLAEESKASPWAPAPGDQATVSQLSDLQVTLNGLQGTVTNSVTGLQAQQTLLANQYTSVISGLSNPNLIPYSGYFESTNGWTYYSNDGTGYLAVAKHQYYENGGTNMLALVANSIKEVFAISERFVVKPNTTYTFTLKGFASPTVNSMDVYVLGRKAGEIASYTDTNLIVSGKVLSPNGLDGVQVTFTTGNINEAFIRIDNNGASDNKGSSLYFTEIKLEEGMLATPYQQTVTSSEISQLTDNINLRVTKNDIISQINVSPESILIDGKKIHLTGATTIDDAIIKSAAIESLSADKIKVGTLNGNAVNVINLNANSITSGAINGANLQISLDSGLVTFQRGRIHSASNNIDINVDAGYMSVANGDTRVMLKNGEMQFVEPQIFDTESSPYLSISNAVSGASFAGAAFTGRDYAVLTNSANSGNIFTSPLGLEDFSGISTGYGLSGWEPTKIGGADRGVFISGGQLMSYTYVKNSPYIFIGTTDGVNAYGNEIYIVGEYVHIPTAYEHTTSASPNLVVGSYGELVRSTSASKYKTNINRGYSTDYGEKLIKLPTATWIDKASLKRYNEDPTQPVPGLNYGMIAEDLAAAGLEHLVVRNPQGGLEGIQYDRIAVALLPLLSKWKQTMDNQEQEINELKEKLGA